jgi:hypothetical protein
MVNRDYYVHFVVGGRGTVEKVTTSLRAFLRHLAVKGRCRVGLADIVPGCPHWRLTNLPRYLAGASEPAYRDMRWRHCRAAVGAIVSATIFLRPSQFQSQSQLDGKNWAVYIKRLILKGKINDAKRNAAIIVAAVIGTIFLLILGCIIVLALLPK